MPRPLYAIGDVHGHLNKLEAAIADIDRDGGTEAQVIFLGDLVDRGPDSKGVIDFVMQGLAQRRNWTVLTGNHDRMFRYFMEPSPRVDMRLRPDLYWLHERLGGMDTLASYGVDLGPDARLHEIHKAAQAVVPDTHVRFLTGLPYYSHHEDLLFVHAGVRPEVSLEDQVLDDLVWIREDFLTYHKPHPWLVVHGHTPVERATHFGNHVNLDSGAGFGRALSVGVFEGGRVWTLDARGRQRMPLSGT